MRRDHAALHKSLISKEICPNDAAPNSLGIRRKKNLRASPINAMGFTFFF
jgi:hypothetical protein